MPDWAGIGRSSRRKGAAFERLCARLINRVFEEETALDCSFRRTPQSGGLDIRCDLVDLNLSSHRIIHPECKARVFSWERMFAGSVTATPLAWTREARDAAIAWFKRYMPVAGIPLPFVLFRRGKGPRVYAAWRERPDYETAIRAPRLSLAAFGVKDPDDRLSSWFFFCGAEDFLAAIAPRFQKAVERERGPIAH